MSVIVNIQLDIAEGKREETLIGVKESLPDTRAYEGCHWVHLVTPLDDDNNIEAISMWDSKEAYDKYFQWRIESGAFEGMADLLAGPPVLRFLNLEASY